MEYLLALIERKKIILLIKLRKHLSSHHINIGCYILRILYIRSIVTTNQKSILDTHTQKKNEKEI